MQKLRTDFNIGSNMRNLRKSNHFTQDRLIAVLNVNYNIDISRGTYSRYETGELNVPIAVLVALRKIYKCSYDSFFQGL